MAIDCWPPGARVPIWGPVELNARLYWHEFTNLTWPASWPAQYEETEGTTTPTARSVIATFLLATPFLNKVIARLMVSSLNRNVCFKSAAGFAIVRYSFL